MTTPVKQFYIDSQPKVVATEELTDAFLEFVLADLSTEAFHLQTEPLAQECEDHYTTIMELTALSKTIRTYGLSRAVLSFADHDGKLSAHIAAIPSLESFKTDRSAKNSVEYVAALEASVGDMFQVWLRTLKSRMTARKTGISYNEHRYQDSMHKLKVMKGMIAEGRVFSEDLAKKRKALLLPKKTLMTAFDMSSKAVAHVKTIVEQKFPTTEAEFGPWFEKARADFNATTHFTGIEIDPYGKASYQKHTQEFVASHGTVFEHGYDSIQDFEAIYTEVDRRLKTELSEMEEAYDKIYAIAEHAHHDTTLAYLKRATFLHLDMIDALWYWVCWVHYVPAMNALKAIFACTEKKK